MEKPLWQQGKLSFHWGSFGSYDNHHSIVRSYPFLFVSNFEPFIADGDMADSRACS